MDDAEFSLLDTSDVALVSIVVMQGRCIRIISKIVSKSCLCSHPAAQTQWTIFEILVTRPTLDFNNFKQRYSENSGEKREIHHVLTQFSPVGGNNGGAPSKARNCCYA